LALFWAACTTWRPLQLASLKPQSQASIPSLKLGQEVAAAKVGGPFGRRVGQWAASGASWKKASSMGDDRSLGVAESEALDPTKIQW